jgi:ribulose-phosphate 3-epimerase
VTTGIPKTEHKRKSKLSASILSADFGRLAEEVKAVELAGTDWIHVDVMDGHFVPNITIGPDVVKAIRGVTALPLDVHLMIEKPERYLESFVRAGADYLGVHVEVSPHLHRTVQSIRELGAKPIVTLNPATSLCAIENVLGDVDMVLIMTVNPGFGGQKFIHSMLPKIRSCREMIDRLQRPVLLEVDGGVHRDTIGDLVNAGVDVFVAGSAVFTGGDYARNIKVLTERMR